MASPDGGRRLRFERPMRGKWRELWALDSCCRVHSSYWDDLMSPSMVGDGRARTRIRAANYAVASTSAWRTPSLQPGSIRWKLTKQIERLQRGRPDIVRVTVHEQARRLQCTGLQRAGSALFSAVRCANKQTEGREKLEASRIGREGTPGVLVRSWNHLAQMWMELRHSIQCSRSLGCGAGNLSNGSKLSEVLNGRL